MQYMPISSDLLSDSEPGHFKEPPPRAGVRRCMSEGSGPQGLPTPSLKPLRGSVRVENSGNMQERGRQKPVLLLSHSVPGTLRPGTSLVINTGKKLHFPV